MKAGIIDFTLAENTEPLQISFSLSRIQRIFNPASNFLSFLIETSLLAGLAVILLGAPLACFFPAIRIPWVDAALIEFALLFLLWGIIKVRLFDLLRSLAKNDRYINTIEVGEAFIFYGLNSLRHREYYKIPLQSCKLARGFFSVSIISNKDVLLGTSLVIPSAAIPFEKLRQLIEREKTSRA